MAHKVSKGGTYQIDRRFPGVGRIKRASGATTRKGFKARNDLLTRLYDRGRFDLLSGIRDGKWTVTEVYAADRENHLDRLTGDRALVSGNLWDAVDEWLPTSARAHHSRRRYKVSFRAVRPHLKKSATIADLGTVNWRRLETEWSGGAADWNHVRRAVSKFLTDTLGDVHHPFRRSVMKAFPKRPESPRVPDITPELLWRVVHAAPEHVRAAYVLLAATGLRVGEYLRLTKAHLKPNTFSIDVPGTKTSASAAPVRVDERLWHWVEVGVPAPVQYKWLRIYWKRALKAVGADPTLRLHDLRHACAQWLVDAGQSEASVQATLRHSQASMTRQYAMQRDRGENAKTMADILLKSA